MFYCITRESTKNKIIELLLSLSDLTLESPPNDPLLYTKTEETEYISILIQAQDYILKGKVWAMKRKVMN